MATDTAKGQQSSQSASQASQPRMRQGGHGMGAPTIENARDFKGAMRRLLSYLGPQAALVVIATLLIIAGVVLKALGPALIGKAIDQFLEKTKDLAGYSTSILQILAVYFGSWVCDFTSGIILIRFGNNIVMRMRRDTFAKIQSLPVSYFDTRQSGDLISRITNDIDMIYNSISQSFSSLVSGVFSMIAMLIAMFALDVRLTLILLIIIPVIAFSAKAIGGRVRLAFKESQAAVGQLNAAIEDSVLGLKVVQAFRREKWELAKFKKINAAARDLGAKAEIASAMMMPLMNFVSALMLAVVVGIGGYLVLSGNGAFSIGVLAAFIMYARRYFEPLMQLTNVYNVLQSGMAGAERVFEIMDEKGEGDGSGKIVTSLSGAIQFDALSFSYIPGKPVLSDISFTAPQGSVVAVVGPSGAGKTTLVNLLSRFYQPSSGRILVNGQDISSFEINSLRQRMGVVLQEPFLFSLSVKDNLTYGRPDASFEQIKEAAEKANAAAFIDRLPDGYNTVLSERGASISQGERQLLAIARALLADPDILILDEATSSVDSLTEARLQEGLSTLMKARTSFVIAHRLSTIRKADKVIVLHDHRIIEEGNHDSLMTANGTYAKLYKMQKTMDEILEESLA